MGKEVPRPQDRPPDLGLQSDAMSHAQDRPPDWADTIPPVDLDPHIHAIPHLTIGTHHQDRTHSTIPALGIFVPLEFCCPDGGPPPVPVINCRPSWTPRPNPVILADRYSPAEHDPGPAIQVNSVKIESGGNEYDQIMSKRELEQYVGHVRTRYKRKDKKIRPANIPLPTGVSPGGKVSQESPQPELPRGCTVPCGSRLTPERLASINIGGNFLSDAENSFLLTFSLSLKAPSHLMIQKWDY